MSVITKMRKQKAIAWTRTLVDVHGNPTFSNPFEVACRWDDENEVFRTSDSREEISRSVVYPDRAMKPGDYLLLATQAEFNAMSLDAQERLLPQHIEGAYPVRATAANPNFKATETLHTAFL